MTGSRGGLLCTYLFVPGDRPDRIAKALRSLADCIIVDLEDAVAVSQKPSARLSAAGALADQAEAASGCIAVRVNGLASGLMADDIAGLEPVWRLLTFIVLPMADVESVGELAALMAAADAAVPAAQSPARPQIIALVESAASVLEAVAIAQADVRVDSLALGPADLSAELGLTPSADGYELLFARSQLVLASSASGLRPPIDGPWLDLQDEAGLRTATEQARRLGFGGKQVLHPRQLGPVAEILAPTADEIAWARAVDAAFTAAESRGVASIQLTDGTFVDYPVARRARNLLRRIQ